MTPADLAWAIGEAQEREAAGLSTTGIADRLAGALLSLHAILTAPLPDLAEIEARAGRATPGPWEATTDGSLVSEDCCGEGVGEIRRGADDLFHVLPAWHNGVGDWERTKTNAAFVAHARSDIPASSPPSAPRTTASTCRLGPSASGTPRSRRCGINSPTRHRRPTGCAARWP